MDKTASKILNQRISTLYPSLVLMDILLVETRYLFLLNRLFVSMSEIAGNKGCIEIYKIDYDPGTNLPTPFLITSAGVDDAKLEQLFDEIVPLLTKAEMNTSL